jgi:hypothetical protein|tara:strand:+ start:140 stop:589 length:450 start_codon:yes stop_codon:yes gene_type:complete
MKILIIFTAFFMPYLVIADDISSDETIPGRCGYVVRKGFSPPTAQIYFIWNKTKNTIDLKRFVSTERIGEEFSQTVTASIKDEMFLVFEYSFKNLKRNGKADKFDKITHKHEIDIFSGGSVKFEEFFINTKKNKQIKRDRQIIIRCKLG